jgi:lysozyme
MLGKLLADAAEFVGRKGAHAAGSGSLPGCDVSSFQGQPKDWRAQAGRISWAGVKVTEYKSDGTRYVNPDAGADLASLKADGKGRLLYAFGHPTASAAETVSFFAAEARALGLEDSDGVSLDLEVSEGRSPAQVSAWAQEVMSRMRQEFDRTPVCYTFLSFAQEGNCSGLGGYPLWMADPSRTPGHPRVPRPWRTWAMHQYSISGSLDRDVANFATLADMQAALGRRKTAPTILEDPVLVLTGAGADTPVALPDGAKTVRLASVGDTTVNVEFAGAPVRKGIRLSWGHGQLLDVPKGAHSLRVYRPADGSPNVQVSIAVS